MFCFGSIRIAGTATSGHGYAVVTISFRGKGTHGFRVQLIREVFSQFWVQIGSNRVGSGRRVRRRARADLVFCVFDKFSFVFEQFSISFGCRSGRIGSGWDGGSGGGRART